MHSSNYTPPSLLCQKGLEPARATGHVRETPTRIPLTVYTFGNSLPAMDVAIQETLFPLPEAAPVPALATAWDRYRHWVSVSDKMGGLLPQNILPDLLGLSRARVSQLVAEGRFTRELLFGQTFVTADSISEFIRQERKSGIHIKSPSMLSLAKISLQMGQQVTGQK